MCGPDMSREVLAYIQANQSDQGLVNILQDFRTLYPYLLKIAQANKIKDPFDTRVVEAYWLGNNLLDTISAKTYFHHLLENTQIKKQSTSKAWEQLLDKIHQGARMHHSFHVFNVWQRTGHTGTIHTLRSMDQCRISWGKVIKLEGPHITVKRQPLIADGNKLKLSAEKNIKITRELEKNSIIDDLKIGDTISMHWGIPCEILDSRELKNLKKYSAWSLALANQTI